jgi:large subunit ribosomal protein L25
MELVAESRTIVGKSVQALRNKGVIPAVLYGRGIENMNLSLDGKAFLKVFKDAGENKVITLLVDGKKMPVLVHDLNRHYLSEDIDHVDFYLVHMDEKIEAPVPIELVGEAPAVKEHGGILNRTMDAVEVEALPGDLPESFKVDVSVLAELNQSIYIKDLIVPPKVRILIDPETVIVSVTPPLKEEVVEAPVVDVSTVKVETEEKKEERDKSKQEEGKVE